MTTSSVKATWTSESTDTPQIKQKFVRDTRFSRRTFQEFKRVLQNRIQQKHLQRLLQNRMQKKHLVDATRWCGVCVWARAFSYNTGHMCISRISELMSSLCGFKPLKVWKFCTSRSSFECHAYIIFLSHAHTRLQVSTWTDQKTSTHQAQVRALCRNGQQQKSAQLLVRFVFDQVMTFLVIILTFWWSRLRSSWRRWVFTKRQAIDAVDRIFDHDDF